METENIRADGAARRVVTLAIHGMHCASCVTSIERALQQLDGVESATVNLATNKARISAGADVTPESLTAAVARAGFEAEIVAAGGAARNSTPSHKGTGGPSTPATATAVILGVVAMALHLAGREQHAAGSIPFVLGLVAILSLSWPGRNLLISAARSAISASPNMDVLVSLGAVASFVSGVAGLLLGNPRLILFDAASMIVAFVTLGKWLENRARRKAGSALSALSRRIPAEGVVIREGRPVTVSIDSIGPGEMLELSPDRFVAVDAEIVEGTVAVDEAIVTGESLPVTREGGDRVLGGTLVVEGRAVARAVASGEESTVAQIARIVEEAQARKPRWQRLADRAAAGFVPAILVLAGLTLAGWWLVGGDFVPALERGVAVLVIACPCALGLAIPMAVLVGTGRAAESGVLVRDPEALETVARVRTVLLDKTGTITIGKPAVSKVVAAAGCDPNQVIAVAAALERTSQHPLARAIVRHAEASNVEDLTAQNVESIAGRGVRGRIAGETAIAGSGTWLAARGITIDGMAERADALSADGASVVWVAHAGRLIGLLGLADELHPESQSAMKALISAGIGIRLLSGDREAAVGAVAARLGGITYAAELTPASKLEAVQEAVRSGIGPVAMVGDGVNDAPALAAADVGIAMGGGADVAREAGDICLVAQSPKLILRAIEISRASTQIMRQNIGWAIGYNALMLPLAAGTAISPLWAAGAMMVSSLSVVLNSLRLRRA